MDFLEKLIQTDNNLFYSRNDPNDVRLGDKVNYQKNEYPDCNVVIIGCPQDEGVRRNEGRLGASLAPIEVRKALYRYPISSSHTHLQLFDMGDVPFDGNLEQTHKTQFEIIRKLIKDRKKVIVLGGGNDISYPDCKALAAEIRSVLVFNIDRHLDVRSAQSLNSGTPYRQLLEENIIRPELFHEVGINSFANSPIYIDFIKEIGAHIHYLGDLRNAGIKDTIEDIVNESKAEGIFWGFDLDVVRAVEAPGVSDPSPMGFTAREVCEIADVAASDPRTQIIEITEVNPKYDIDGITSKLAANIIMRCLAKE
jgi:formiminoglutamase